MKNRSSRGHADNYASGLGFLSALLCLTENYFVHIQKDQFSGIWLA